MSDTAAAEAPAEPVPPIPPAPEAAAELDAAPPQADAPAAENSDLSISQVWETVRAQGVGEVEIALPQAPEAVASAEAPAERALPFDVEHLGLLRRAVLDHLLDTEGPQSVAQIIASMPPGTTRGSAESAIKREFDAGRIMRTSPGHYALAPAMPPERAQPAPPAEPDKPEDEWFVALEAWLVDRASWDVEALGPRPNEPGNRIPPDVRTRFADRMRKRTERRREAEAAAARQSAADAELRDRLIAATGGNIVRGPAIDDVSPIQMAMQLVPLERILSSIRNKTDRKMFPGNEPATSWREERLLREIAESYFLSIIQPRLVAAWSAAGRAPAPTAQSSPPASDMPDDTDELRRRHDDPSAPPGPHVVPGAAPSVLDAAPAPQEPVDRAEPPAAVSAPLGQESAPASFPTELPAKASKEMPPSPDVTVAAPILPAPQPVADGRAAVLAAFARGRAQASPQPAPPQPPRPAPPQPQLAQRQVEPPRLSDEATDELIAGWKAGNLAWPRRLLGEEPGHPDCRVSRAALRRNGL